MNTGRLLLLIVGLTAIVVMAAALFDHAPGASDSEETDVIFLMGQSNAAYREATAVAAEAEPVPEEGTAWFWGQQYGIPANFNFTTGSLQDMSNGTGAAIGDKWPALASEYIDKTGHKVVMAQIAKAGMSITRFSPEDGDLWTASVSRVEQVITAMNDAGMSVGLVHVVWIQGEQDYNMSEAEYETRLLQIGTAISNGGLGHDVNMPLWISKTRGSGGSVAAQEALTQEKPGMFRFATTIATTFTVENGLMSPDNLHYSQAGNNLLGSEIGATVGEEAKHADKMTEAIWGLITIGIGAMVVFGCVAAITRD